MLQYIIYFGRGMKTINRLLLGSIWVLFGVFAFPWSFVAQWCSACNTTPEELDTYMNVMDELISFVMENPRIDDDEEAQDVREKTLIQFDKEITNQRLVAENLLQTVVKSPVDLNPFSSWAILRKWSATVRDKLLLEDIDTKLIQALLVAQREWYLPKLLESEQYDQIDSILQETDFMQLQQRDWDYNMQTDGANYADLIWLLWQLNQIIKTFHTNEWYDNQLNDIAWQTIQANVEDPVLLRELPIIITLLAIREEIDNVVEKNLSPLTDGTYNSNVNWIEFTEEKNILLAHVWAIQEAYLCATWVRNECNDPRTDGMEYARNNIEDEFKRWWWNAINTFKESFSRLIWALYMWSPADKQAAQQRQDALMQSTFWFTNDNPRKWRDWVWNIARSSPTTIWAVWKMFARVARNTVNVEYNTTASPWLSRAISSARNIQDANVDTETWKETSTRDKIDQIASYGSPRFEEITDRPEVPYQSDGLDLRGITQGARMDREARSLFGTYQNMLSLQKNMNKTFAFVSPYEYTKQFPALSKAVYNNIDMIEQETETIEWLWIYNAMGQICEEQCSNLTTNCRADA